MDSWCHMCGSLEGSERVEDELDHIISQVFKLELSEKVICAECSGYIHGISDFKARVHLIQKMFLEIECQAELTLINIIRTNYGLTEMLDDGEEANHIESGVEGDYNTEEELELDETQYLEVKTSLDECDAIPKSSKTSKSQKRTVKRTENEKLYEFKCHICGVEFSKMQLLTTHCKSSHQSFPKVLCWCGAVLSTWKRLMSHKSKHLKQNDQFSCTECKISYKTRIAFEKHFSMKHGPDKERFICTQCGKEFKERQILKNHEKIHLPDELKLKFPCNECGKKFVNSHCLKIHNARVHQKVALHTCELCGKGCITKSDLKWHMDKHVQERNFECDICNLKFKSANSLRIHKKRHFNQEKKFICPTCGKEFFSSAALSNHKLVHSDVKRYKCFCGNEYKRLESYKCHLNSMHTGERPFNCHWCDKTFVNSANCRKHKLKEHSQEVKEYEAAHGKKGVSLAARTPQKVCQ